MNAGSEKKALVFNQYLQTAGGGERLCFEIAFAVQEAGYQVDFVVLGESPPELAELLDGFGFDREANFSVRLVPSLEELSALTGSGEYDVFINNTHGCFVENRAPQGIYISMFPQQISRTSRVALESYTTIYCISGFTELYTLRRWMPGSTVAIVPPISDTNFSSIPPKLSEKERLILCVGRFNVDGHTKCQLEAINAFVAMQHSGAIGKDWRLVVAGRLNAGDENYRYLGACAKAASSNVTILEGLPLDQLQELYRRAAALWQFTGYGIPFGERPEHCEHLGLVALDCFAFGTIPFVYQRGGMPYILSHGVNGFCFRDADELAVLMQILDRDFLGGFHEALFIHSLESGRRFRSETFRAEFGAMLRAGAKNSTIRGGGDSPGALGLSAQR
jgi:glycosyltransferase involved in cell wall biosynthesis